MFVDTAAWDAIQQRARSRIWDGFKEVKCLAAVAPTGFGKTRLGSMLIKDVQAKGYPWVWYTHRKTLTTQTMRSFQDQGLDFGVRASGLPEYEDITKPGQVAMLQSERSAIKSGKRKLHDARFVIVDESHANKNGWAEEAIRHHLNNGDRVLQLSATPVGQGHISEKLIELASMSEMLDIGALLKAECWSPSELDMKHIRKIASGEYSPGDQANMVMQQQVVGDIIKWYHNLNPDQVPTLGFGPDVKSSMWLCDYFNDHGIKSAHIDGEKIYLGEHDLWGNPVVEKSNQRLRDQLIDRVSTGEIKVLWNRFVMREGVDIPALGHAIFACAFGQPETWIQAVGRVLRADLTNPAMSSVRIQDHGGNLHRAGLGHPNDDRLWSLHDTNKSIVEASKKARENGEEDASVRCPSCAREVTKELWKASGYACPHCGESFRKDTRQVIQTDGTLRLVESKDKAAKCQTFQQTWEEIRGQCYWSGDSCGAAYARFRQKTGITPQAAGVKPLFSYEQRKLAVNAVEPRRKGQRKALREELESLKENSP